MRSPNEEKKTIATLVTTLFLAVLIIAIGYSLEAWLLGLILSWFSVGLTFWQCFATLTRGRERTKTDNHGKTST